MTTPRTSPSSQQTTTDHATEEPRDKVEREDLVMFINACFACTRQQEFYSHAYSQGVSIEFLHEYILGNYRRLYARTLAAGINHFNQMLIVFGLLAAGSPARAVDRSEEAHLIATTLERLPPNRVFRLFALLRERRINNRRTRAVIRRYLAHARDPVFFAVKYRNKLRTAVAHAHLKLPGEMGPFLFRLSKQRKFETRLFEQFRQAHYSADAIYELPYTIAEGLAAKHRVPRDRFLQRIQHRMTAAEKLRMQGAASREKRVNIDVDLTRVPLTKLALYILSLSPVERAARRDELDHAMRRSSERALRRAPVKLGRLAIILDNSYSSSGSSEKRRRPLGVALAARYLMQAASREHLALWTSPPEHDIDVVARGQSGLAIPLLDALDWRPDLVIIVSDGFENDPPHGAAEVARVFRKRIDPECHTDIIHVNPVFDAENYAPRTIGPAIPTVGVRDAEDIPTMLGFARFASGSAPLAELERYLAARVASIRGSEDRERRSTTEEKRHSST